MISFGRRTVLRVRTDPDVTHVVVAATEFARNLDFGETESRAIGTVVSELATNIIKYADHGQVKIEEVEASGRRGVRVTVTDRGPGIENLEQALQDHFSSSGTLGLGLPGVRRMVDEFDVQSEVGHGTTVTVSKWGRRVGNARSRLEIAPSSGSEAFAERGTVRNVETFGTSSPDGRALEVAAVNRPCRGELVSGDAVAWVEVDGGVLFAVVDGLGHGRDANIAAKAATRYVKREPSADLERLMFQLDERLGETVGAAVALCSIDIRSGMIRYCAIGNTVLRIEGDRAVRIGAAPGTVGGRVGRVRVESAQLSEGEVLLMHTDGVSDRTGFDGYPQLRYHAPETVVETIIKRFGKSHDDATCVACRFRT